MSKRKKPEVTVNVTINQYFHATPSPAPPPGAPGAWLPEKVEGELRAVTGEQFRKCSQPNCPRGVLPTTRFAPRNSPTDAFKFEKALDSLRVAIAAEDGEAYASARGKLLALVKQTCDTCRDINIASHTRDGGPIDECEKTWREIQEWLGPCAVCGYLGASIQGWRPLTTTTHTHQPTPTPKPGDHGTNSKVEALSDAHYWSSSTRGPAAMWREAQQLHQSACACCHSCESTSNTGKRAHDRAEVDAMPDGARNGTPLEIKQCGAKYSALAKIDKYLYVDERKRAIGCCAFCDKQVAALGERGGAFFSTLERAHPLAFQFNHLPHTEKLKYRRKPGCGGGVAEICGDSSIRMNRKTKVDADGMPTVDKHAPRTGPTGEELLETETDPEMTNLLCANCHMGYTHHGLTRELALAEKARNLARVNAGAGSSM